MRYIDADKLRKDVLDMPNCYNGFSDTYDKAIILDIVDEQPTVDVESLNTKHEDIGYEKGYRDGYAEALEVTDNAEPVRRGHWTNISISVTGNSSAECSRCGAVVHDSFSNAINYCPNCGAKMDEVEDAKHN